MFHKTRIVTTLFGIALLSTAAFAKDDSRAFLRMAARNGMYEVDQAQVALKMASNNEIRDFANHMIEDHGKANSEVKELAGMMKLTLPDSMTKNQEKVLERLREANDRDRDFDRKYISQAVMDHKAAVKAFEKQAKMGTDADVRAFADRTLPKLKKHLDMAIELNTKLNTKSNMN
jgi:putative membrane protein